MSEFHDFVQLPAEGQVTPTAYTGVGILTTVNSPQYLGVTLTSALATAAGPFIAANFQMSTQDNNANMPEGYLSNYAWQTPVVGPIYNSPGGILNKAPSGLTTGGGP